MTKRHSGLIFREAKASVRPLRLEEALFLLLPLILGAMGGLKEGMEDWRGEKNEMRMVNDPIFGSFSYIDESRPVEEIHRP